MHFWQNTNCEHTNQFFTISLLFVISFYKRYKVERKNFRIMTQGLLNPGFMKEKKKKGDFLKKPSGKLKNIFCFRFE